ncbi:MAG: xanthine dehydrogenase family protein subunit M [Planctomycetes bacterium]|nr:xanthine dehydrogenase family protein subunit M [Planctomycetota bacterium]
MKPAAFRYLRPRTTNEALAMLAEHAGEAKLLAGGQSLVPTMNFRLAQPAVLVDLNGISELAYIRPRGDGTSIGAMTRQRAVERSELVASRAPLVAETMPWISHPQIRNRGTFGGSIAHADPAAELPAVAVALGARMRALGVAGERWIAARDFFTGLMATALEPDEILVEVELPALPPRTGTSFQEAARRHGDYALLGVAAVVGLDVAGRCREARLVYLSAGETPVVAQGAARALVGEAPTDEALRVAAEIAASKDLDPPGDIHASPAFRRHLARGLTVRALDAAIARARSSNDRKVRET